jgi:hypothetical protein
MTGDTNKPMPGGPPAGITPGAKDNFGGGKPSRGGFLAILDGLKLKIKMQALDTD